MIEFLKNKTNLTIFLLVLWQLISVGLIGTGVWTLDVVWVNFILISVFIVCLSPMNAIGVFLVSLPFMLVLPNPWLDNFPMWRPLALLLFLVISIKYFYSETKQNNLWTVITEVWKTKVAVWDKWLAALFLLACLSLLFSRFPQHGLKQIIFVVNAYVVYIAVRLVVNSENFHPLLKYLKASLFLTIILGFAQYILTLFAEPYYFWQYWASLISSSYYGQPLADVLVYSNSWFSSDSGGKALRMFGILQDTHAFGVVAIFGLAIHLIFSRIKDSGKAFLASQGFGYWFGLAMLCFAVVASGTRGIWIAMFVPVVIALFLLWRYKVKLLTLLPLISYGLVIVLFILSPFITMGLNFLRVVNQDDNFLNRAASIYDLSENSNAGRIEIWKSSFSYATSHLTGTGYGNFIVSMFPNDQSSSYEQLANQENDRYNLPEKFITAHSLYLHLLVELGILGLLLFLAVCISLAWQILQKLKSANFELSLRNLVLINFGLAVAWLLAYGIFDVTILNERVLLYLMIILAAINFSILETKDYGISRTK
jgi:O-antigen ligase